MGVTGWSSMPGQPRHCEGCGKRVALTRERDQLWFHTGPGEPTTWHHECRQAALRLDRLDDAIGELAADVDRDDQLRSVLNGIHRRTTCDGCDEAYDPLAVKCASCGTPTHSPYAQPRRRAAPAPLEAENLQIAESP